MALSGDNRYDSLSTIHSICALGASDSEELRKFKKKIQWYTKMGLEAWASPETVPDLDEILEREQTEGARYMNGVAESREVKVTIHTLQAENAQLKKQNQAMQKLVDAVREAWDYSGSDPVKMASLSLNLFTSLEALEAPDKEV